jgi:hypothetical protein
VDVKARRSSALASVVLALATGCGSSSRDAASDLKELCSRPLDSLRPSDATSCIAAGYYKELVRKRASQPATDNAPAEPERRVLVLDLVGRDGSRAGELTVTEHPQGDTVVFGTEAKTADTVDWVVRPGTCSHPGRGRGYHLTYSGEANAISYAAAVASTFAVEIVGFDGRATSCAEHKGRRRLAAADTSPAEKTGHAQLRNGRLVFRRDGLDLIVAPAAGGKQTNIEVTDLGAGNADAHVHLRRGSCREVTPGREWPLLLGSDQDADGQHVSGAATLAIPFDLIKRGDWVFERHQELIGADVASCIEL